METMNTMKPKFETRPGFKSVGMMIPTNPGSNEIPELWDKFVPHIDSIPNRINHNTCYGIINPYGPKESDGEMDYISAVEVDNFDNVPDGMIAGELPESYYAVFTHRGPISNFMETIRFVFGEWLPNSEYTLTGTSELEVYDERFNPTSDSSECEICLPVKKK
jgi:AraC family transcriptional regulator